MTTFLEIVPAWRDALTAAGLVRFDDFMHVRGGPPASRHRHRETIPLTIPATGAPRLCYLKRVFWVPPRHALWPLARGRRGRAQPWREWHAIAALQQGGVPVMQRVALGERRRWGRPTEAFLLVEAVPERHTVAEWIVPGYSRPSGAAQVDLAALWRRIGDCLGRLHATGHVWPDLHAKHLFAAPGRDRGEWSIRLIDVERLDGGRPNARLGLHPEDRLHDLHRFLDSLSPLVVSADHELAFMDSYVRAVPPDRREELAERLTPLRARLANDRRTSIRLPDDFIHPDCAPMTRVDGVWAAPPGVDVLRRARLDSLNAVFSCSDGQLMSKPGLAGHRDRIRLDLATDGGGTRPFYLKRYRRPPIRQQVERAWQARAKRGTAWREVHFIKRLGRMGIATMRCLAWGEEMRCCLERRSFVLTEGIDGESLEKRAARTATPLAPDAARLKREIIRQLAAITSRLHSRSLFHRDLYLSHVFLTHNSDGGVVLRLIDLARMYQARFPLRRRAVKDLAALDYSAPAPLVTRADRIRFLAAYLGRGDPAYDDDWRPAARRWIADVRRRVRRMARHDENRRRALRIEATG